MKKALEIAATPAAFDILANKLYSNPRLAVLRELSTNANDVHIMAGKTDKSFQLHIPTDNDHYFRVRDFGPGLTVDEFEVIYFNFFVSTKKDDETQTGNFGLGAKSPFACANSFKVSSYQNGKKVTYQLQPEDGIPTYEIIEDTETDEPDGLEIYIDDWKNEYNCNFYEWERIAKKFFKSTAFLPDMNFGEEDLDVLLKKRPFYQANNFIIQEDTYCPIITCNVAGVGFDVNVNELNSELLEAIKALEIGKMNIIAGKNDVTVTPSREELQYDEKTKKFLNDSIISIFGTYDAASHTFEELRELNKKIISNFKVAFEQYLPLITTRAKNNFATIAGNYGFSTMMTFSKENKWFEYSPSNCNVKWCVFGHNKKVIVDTRNISRTLEKSLEIIKKDPNKLPTVICYYSGYAHDNQLNQVQFIPSNNPEAAKKAFYELTGETIDIVALKDMSRWTNPALAGTTATKDSAARKRMGWLTSAALTAYNGNIGRGCPSFDISGLKVAYIATSWNANEKIETIALLQKFTGDDTFVVIRQGSEEWIAKQRKAGINLTTYTTFKESLMNSEAAIKVFKEISVRNDLEEALISIPFSSTVLQSLIDSTRTQNIELIKLAKEFYSLRDSLKEYPYKLRRLVCCESEQFKTDEYSKKMDAAVADFKNKYPMVALLDSYKVQNNINILIDYLVA